MDCAVCIFIRVDYVVDDELIIILRPTNTIQSIVYLIHEAVLYVDS